MLSVIYDARFNIPSCIVSNIANKPNFQDFIMSLEKSFYYYNGSDTVPGCNENMQWIVMSSIQFMSYD